MEKKVVNAIVGGAISVGGLVIGALFQSYRNLKNTPEAVIARLEAAKAESKAAASEARSAEAANNEAYSKLLATESEWRAECRKELEPKIRQEFQDYIDKADDTYAKAKQERAISEAKLELMKRIERDNSKLYSSRTGV